MSESDREDTFVTWLHRKILRTFGKLIAILNAECEYELEDTSSELRRVSQPSRFPHNEIPEFPQTKSPGIRK